MSKLPDFPLPINEVGKTALDAVIRAATTWPFNITCVTIDEADRSVEIRSGGWGSAPLYALVRDGTLWADWDAARLYPVLHYGLDHCRAIYSMVHIGHPYSRQTVFQELILLTERSLATWDTTHDRVNVQYPTPVPRLKPRRLRESADVVTAFAELMHDAVGMWIDAEVPMGTQLSGGIDSSVVAIALASYDNRPVHSYGLIMPGLNGEFQAERRQELVTRFGLLDFTLPGERYLPLAPDSSRNADGSILPWSEFYYDSVAALNRRAREDGIDVLFGGLGGDELSTLLRSEQPVEDADGGSKFQLPAFLTPRGIEAYYEALRSLDRAPRPATELSSVEAAATNADVFLRQGLWPAYPYCVPDVVNFCRSLPGSWRQDRDFQRQYLERHGCSNRVAHPEVTETFDDVMTMAMQRNHQVIVRLFQESRLAQAGLIDPNRLLSTYEGFRTHGNQRWKDSLVELSVLELTIRAIEQATPVSAPAMRD